MNRTFGNYSDSIALPKLVKLGPNLFGAAFTLMKLIPARHILHKAARSGRLARGGRVVETTSGTFGLALAMEAALHDWKLTLVSDPVIDKQLAARLRGLGAELDIVTEPAPGGGYQQPRLDRVDQLLREDPDAFCPQQYSNPDNPRSYFTVAESIVDRFGQLDTLIGPVGSGGSMCGTAKYLRQVYPSLQAVAVDTHHSVIFGQPDGPRDLRGLGNSLVPANVDHTTFDDVHWLSQAHAAHATRGLHRAHAAFMGPTSGAAYAVASWYAQQHPERLHLVMLPDEGYRYQATVYDDAWFRANAAGSPPARPRLVEDPLHGTSGWSYMHWGRRPLHGEPLALATGGTHG
ncbi:cysteine synthase family protein [Streptomyces sp. NPDC002779]|uniref:cysteine synthase family protein n=1 Tax=Streptomyces sp. NPDC002779 TaxID=3364664 RepID=UPI0036763631